MCARSLIDQSPNRENCREKREQKASKGAIVAEEIANLSPSRSVTIGYAASRQSARHWSTAAP